MGVISNFIINENNMLTQTQESDLNVTWLDVLEPSIAQRKSIETTIKAVLPEHNEMYQIEFSNQFYDENDAVYMCLNVVTKAAPIPESHVVTFVLTKQQLISLRYSDPNPIQSYIDHNEKHPYSVNSHLDVFNQILHKLVGSIADIFEIIDVRTDELATGLMGAFNSSTHNRSKRDLKSTLTEINYLQCLLSKGYQSLTSFRLMFTYIQEPHHKIFNEKFINELEILIKDTKNLTSHAEHLTQKLGFQLQATLGLINNEQTHIITIFTVLAMVFMPPTLIASIYGMNFHFMPELATIYGYPLALILMVISSYLPYRYFKKKGWI